MVPGWPGHAARTSGVAVTAFTRAVSSGVSASSMIALKERAAAMARVGASGSASGPIRRNETGDKGPNHNARSSAGHAAGRGSTPAWVAKSVARACMGISRGPLRRALAVETPSCIVSMDGIGRSPAHR